MFFRIQIFENQKFLTFFTPFLKVKKEIDFLLNYNFDSLKIKNQSNFYYLTKTKVYSDRDFYRFLLKIKNIFNLTLNNPDKNEWIDFFLKDLLNYEKRIQIQSIIYEQILNQKKINEEKINKSLFLKTFIPKPFQTDFTSIFLNYKRFANFSAPGSGKTIVSYMTALSLFADNKIQLLIVVGPKSAKTAWFEEWKIICQFNIVHADQYFNFSDKKTEKINDLKSLPLEDNKLNLIFINFTKFQNKSFANHFLTLVKDYSSLLIIDEAHYIKNYKGLLHTNLIELSSRFEYVHLLTGTPLPRFSAEGFYIINFLFPDVEDKKEFSEKVFKKSFLKIDNFYQKQLISNFKLFFVRRSKKQLIDDGFLLKMKEKIINIPLERIEEILITKSKNIISKMNITFSELEKIPFFLIRRMQASSYPPLLFEKFETVVNDLISDITDRLDSKELENKIIISSRKINLISNEIFSDKLINSEVKEYIKKTSFPERWNQAQKILEKKNKERIVVWDVFKKSMFAFKRYLNKLMPKRPCFLINGDLNTAERDNIINLFKKSFNGILIASPATIAESVSLHREVDTAIYLYKNYMGSHFMQSKDRIHRLVGGHEIQKQKTIYFIEAQTPSIDQEIIKNLKQKEKEQNNFID